MSISRSGESELAGNSESQPTFYCFRSKVQLAPSWASSRESFPAADAPRKQTTPVQSLPIHSMPLPCPVLISGSLTRTARLQPVASYDHLPLISMSSTKLRILIYRLCVSAPCINPSSPDSFPAHPINSVVNTPGASTASLVSTATSLNRGTYSVRVTARHKHSASQSSTAPSEVERYSERDNDAGQLLRLRSDPSVASLLDLYDMHGRVSTDAFHNSPVKAGRAVKQAATTNDGRAQINRNGSTLRQLLGDPSETTVDSFEGDISWAERFLG